MNRCWRRMDVFEMQTRPKSNFLMIVLFRSSAAIQFSDGACEVTFCNIIS